MIRSTLLAKIKFIVLALGMKCSFVYKVIQFPVYHIARKQIKRLQIIQNLVDYFIWNQFKGTIYFNVHFEILLFSCDVTFRIPNKNQLSRLVF